jgi:L-lactate dehydrogenase complex protein LldF
VAAALADPHLQQALTESLPALRARRDRAFEAVDFEAGRRELKRRRQANLERLPELVEEFRAQLEAVGGRFHLAADAAEAREVVAAICREAGAGIVTKSKSMATEEIELNPHLEGLGMEVVETDLGEFIVQRLRQRPGHLIAPAVHLTLDEWARTLQTEARPEAILAHARRELRDKFVNAAVGITGANAAIAETGTVMLVTNEGNADLTATLPRVHIAVFGIDKVVASLDDAVAMLRMLPRSGTGQPITTYVNWITGPSRSADIGGVLQLGAHGPRELHCVVLDNGRRRMLADPIFADALTCVRCGACSNACPAFMAVGGHQFGHIYNGPIGLVLTPFHHGLEPDELPQSLCTQCNACQEICPVDIPLPRQILEHRRHAGRKTLEKRALLEAWSRPGLARTAARLAAPLSRLVPGSPPLASRPYRARAPRDGDSAAAPSGPATVFASCLVDQVMPEVGEALHRILIAAGHRVHFPQDQWCCGLICANAGDFERGAGLHRRLAAALARSEGPIVTPSASCFGAFTMDAAEWGEQPPESAPVAARMVDATRFVLHLLESCPDLVQPTPPLRVAYHDSCQTARQLGLRAEPRRLLELAGCEVVDLPDIANCCGFGGTFSLDWPQVADRMTQWKLEAVARTGCRVVASDNPGCLLQIRSGAQRRGLDLRVAHVLELVAERLAPAGGYR